MILYDILQGIGDCIGVLYHFLKIKRIPHPSHCGLRKMAHIPEYKGYLLLEENRNIMFNISDAKVYERGREEERGKKGQGSREES